jgi:hypothetical protein
MSKHNRERRKFGARRQPTEAIFAEFTRNPGAPLPAVQAFMAAHRHTFGPGVHQIVTMHDASCRYPSGGACTCSAGPEIKIVGRDPAAN